MIQKIIPTNVITGFLGVGKTSFIKTLLSQKPADEVWAVLVNEFGEVGIDAGLLGNDNQQVEIKEVAGGCMCCAAGLPMQVAINQLIAKAKPDRLLIEPTGLGHPQEVLKVLTQAHYQQVLSMKSCITLVDARKLSDSRYTQHEIFNQQLQVADLVLASKADCYDEALVGELQDYLKTNVENQAMAVERWSYTQHEALMPAILTSINLPHKLSAATNVPVAQAVTTAPKTRLLDINYSPLFSPDTRAQQLEFDERGLVCKTKQADGFYSCGWIFDVSYEFDFDKLLELVKGLDVVRLKAVMITNEGIAGFNGVESELSIVELDDAMASRIELLSMSALNREQVEAVLIAASKRLGC
ncbi:Cobalamin synthesis protein/P47K [Shewanella piezotolerans WP3]|uniref:Cobalamin synthesis protein/P47K n=1 Tax=Shewanella piezotolerans (strain WP3 / JCM 13877) TaxID=225849 RepID=B8CS38_SHEPW|nr:GTP-binding protein [Shewanella piezotolerans]ACJ30328.1 Cobalamin synthesis protein/P47K [Shewanella piezotolerans WP3]